ncbi:MAG: hypothetical protein NTZ48_00145, partial [Candidatus Omnitrophica bacterium]|nr:hypothetical protein [Candidatus Omnitrophota bacterium]
MTDLKSTEFRDFSAVQDISRVYVGKNAQGETVIAAVQYLTRYQNSRGENQFAFSYIFPTASDSSYVCGFYTTDEKGGLKEMKVFDGFPELQTDSESWLPVNSVFSANLTDKSSGYNLIYTENIGGKERNLNINVKDYTEVSGDNVSFNINVNKNMPDERAYHVAKDHYLNGLYAGEYWVKIENLSGSDRFTSTYHLDLPGGSTIDLLSGPNNFVEGQTAKEIETGTERWKPYVQYVKNTSDGAIMGLSFLSPVEISRADMQSDNFLEQLIGIISERNSANNFTNFNFTFSTEDATTDTSKVYTFKYFPGDANTPSENTISCYSASNAGGKFSECSKIYNLTSDVSYEIVNQFLRGDNSIEPFLMQNMSNGTFRGSTEYIWEKQEVAGGEALITLTKNTVVKKEDGSIVADVSRWSLPYNKVYEGILNGEVADPNFSETFVQQQIQDEALTSKTRMHLETDSSGAIIAATGTALKKINESQEGGTASNWWWSNDPDTLRLVLDKMKEVSGVTNLEDYFLPSYFADINDSVGFVIDTVGNKFIDLEYIKNGVEGVVKAVDNSIALSALGLKGYFLIREYDYCSGILNRTGVTLLNEDGSMGTPLFYIQEDMTKRIEGSSYEFIVTKPMQYSIPTLAKLLEFVGKSSAYERGEVVEIDFMNTLYQYWSDINGGYASTGVAPKSGSMMEQIEKSWKGYVDLLQHEAERAGYSIKIADADINDRGIPLKLSIQKGTIEAQKILKVSVRDVKL